MNSGKENITKKADQDKSSKTNLAPQYPSWDKTKQTEVKKDIDAERHPEEQIPEPKVFVKKESKYFDDKSDRV